MGGPWAGVCPGRHGVRGTFVSVGGLIGDHDYLDLVDDHLEAERRITTL
jgi:hypothetical protein